MTRTKGIVFFSREIDVGNSFIQIRKLCFFSRSHIFGQKKKTRCIFFFRGKVHRPFIRILRNPLFFLIKMCCVFFTSFLCVFLFFFFPRKSSHVIHSFDFQGRKKKQPGKKTAFSFIQKISPKSAQKRSYPGKKKIRYLCWRQNIFYKVLCQSLLKLN